MAYNMMAKSTDGYRQTSKETDAYRAETWRNLRKRYITKAKAGGWHEGVNLWRLPKKELAGLLLPDKEKGRFNLLNIHEAALLGRESFHATPVKNPTDVRPGSRDKIETMAARIAAGADSAFHPLDFSCLPDSEPAEKNDIFPDFSQNAMESSFYDIDN
jgi:hypothetical protein